MKSWLHRMKVLTLICGICLVLLFVGGPGYYSPRSYQQAWDLGHILFFAILTYLLVNQWQRLSKEPFNRQGIGIFIIALFLGVAIELLQSLIDGRTPSYGDIIRNFIGCLVALAFFIPSRKKVPRTRLRILQFSVVLIAVLQIFPVAKSLIDEAIAREQFPVLSDFETPFEIDRWSSRSRVSINHEIAKHGKSSLKVRLTTAQYSGIALRYFPHDWRGFDSLQFNVYNASSTPLEIVCRVHDSFHYAKGGRYDDRFNKRFTVTQGWNDIKISLEDIAKAPKSREMDLSSIQGFGIRVLRLPQPEVVYIDNVRLVR